MCTVSWLRGLAGYQVFFNRDERRTRAPELPPEEAVLDGVRWLSPRDGDQGGTWIAVNQNGITIGLLNRWDTVEEPSGTYTSRGELAISLMNLESLDELTGRLLPDRLTRYKPFQLVAFGRTADAQVVAWDGRSINFARHGRSGLVATSSGHDQVGAETARNAIFSKPQDGWSAEYLEELHRSHLPTRGALSPCMHRTDAATVSFTSVRVEEHEIDMEYAVGPPCEVTPKTYRLDT